MRAILGFVACGMLLLGCGGDGGGTSPGKKKKKKSSGSSSAKQVLEELQIWADENAKDWPGFKEKLAAARKKLKGDKKGTARLKKLYEAHKGFVPGVLEGAIKTISDGARKPENEAYWEKNLKRFDTLEKQMRDFDAAFAEKHLPKINEERLWIVTSQFEKVRDFVRANRTDADKVVKELNIWRERLKALGDLGADMLKEMDEMEAGTKEVTEWMKKTPPGGVVDLLAPEHRDAWESIEKIKATWDNNEVVLEGTGSEKTDFGVLLHRAFWWTNFQIEMTFEVEEKGFTVLGRGHPPRSGVNQRVRGSTFSPGRPWRLTITIDGGTMTLTGDIQETKYKAGGQGGGVGFYLGPGDKARILMFQVQAK